MFTINHLLTVLPILLASYAECADILLISNCVSHSHSLWYNKLATLLAESGHRIVLLDTDPLRTKASNVTHFLIEGAYDFSDMNITPEVMEQMFERMSESPISNLDMYLWFSKACRKYLKSNGVADLMRTYRDKKFDLIITDYYCDSFYGLVHHFGGPPFIIATAFADPESVLEKVGLYDNPSYVPARLFSSFPVKMNFAERATNTLYYLYRLYKFKTMYTPFEEESAKEIFGPDSPSVLSISRNVSLVMVNTHFAVSGAKPLPPAVVPVFGFHIDPVKPLPKDIKTFLDDAKSGAILFSFGTNIPPEMISQEKIRSYIKVFSSIPQRVIWKFDEKLLDKAPGNVMIRKWLPQTDILAHDNLVAFISHGGLLGVHEAMYFGVPIIGFPFFIDQISNIDRIVNNGLGVKLTYKSTSTELLLQGIREVTENQSYRRKMKDLSKVLQDLPMKPRETVKYWIEYILRNKRHLGYIRSQAADLPIYQLLLLDVLAAALGIGVAVLATLWILAKTLCRIILCIKKSRRKEKEN